MRIAFLCGGLEPGRDGAGDYTSGLAEELRQQGHEPMVISLRDKFVSEAIADGRQIAGGSIQTLRLLWKLPWPGYIRRAKEQLEREFPMQRSIHDGTHTPIDRRISITKE